MEKGRAVLGCSRLEYRMHISTLPYFVGAAAPILPRLLPLMLGVLVACSSGSPAGDGKRGADDTSAPQDSAAPEDTAPPEDTGAADDGGPVLDDAALVELLTATWVPVSMNDSGTERPLPDDPASYLLLDAEGGVAFGCGAAPFGTWTATVGGAAGAVGVIEVSFGSSRIVWAVLSVDAESMIFAEGGDSFTHRRGACP